MNQQAQVRTLEFYVRGTWLPGTWESLKKDMIFRLREPNGQIVDEGTEHEVSVALRDAKAEPAPAFWGVKCDPFTIITMDHPLAPRIRLAQEDGVPLGPVLEMNVAQGIAKLGGDQTCSGVYVEILPGAQPSTPKKVGSVYLHVGNSGVTFTVQDGPYGPCVEIHCSTFGNMDHTIKVHTTPKGLTALKQLFDVAAERTYDKPYCFPAYPVYEYTTEVDADGDPILVEVPEPPQVERLFDTMLVKSAQ